MMWLNMSSFNVGLALCTALIFRFSWSSFHSCWINVAGGSWVGPANRQVTCIHTVRSHISFCGNCRYVSQYNQRYIPVSGFHYLCLLVVDRYVFQDFFPKCLIIAVWTVLDYVVFHCVRTGSRDVLSPKIVFGFRSCLILMACDVVNVAMFSAADVDSCGGSTYISWLT